MTDENRILVREGLKRLHRTANPGMRALILQNQLTPEQIEQVYKSAHHIREWYDQHPEIETWEDYIRYMRKSDEGQEL